MKRRRVIVLLLVVGVAVGAPIGLLGFTFIYADGAAYLTNNPAACANCHVMQEQYDGWMKGSHASVATCNDCHTPHSFVGKYLTKADNGFWHSFAFTTGKFHEPIRIKPRNFKITESACRHCHGDIVAAMASPEPPRSIHPAGATVSCIRCHRDVGHAH